MDKELYEIKEKLQYLIDTYNIKDITIYIDEEVIGKRQIRLDVEI